MSSKDREIIQLVIFMASNAIIYFIVLYYLFGFEGIIGGVLAFIVAFPLQIFAIATILYFGIEIINKIKQLNIF